MKPFSVLFVVTCLHTSFCYGLPVSVRGEFISYTGPAFEATTSPAFNTTLNGAVLAATGVVDVPGVGRVGTATHAFLPDTSAVFFQNTENTPQLANAISFAGTVDLDGVVAGVPFPLGVFSLTNGIWFRSDVF